MTFSSERTGFRPDIEGLRGVAIAGVLFYHLNREWAPFGYLGVDVFFVISGFVVASSAAGRMERENPGFLKLAGHFFQRRVRRLVPPLAVVALATLAIVLLAIPPEQIKLDTIRTALFAMAGWSNVHLAWRSTDYWHDANLPNAFLHSWSLEVEDQFYLIFPLIFFTLAKCTPRWRMVLSAVMLIGAAGFSVRQEASDALKAFYLLPSRVWEPVLGVITFFVSQQLRSKGSHPSGVAAVNLAFAVNAVLLGGLVMLMLAPAGSITSRSAMFVSCGVVALMIAINSRHSAFAANSVLCAMPLRIIGRGAYSCYLVHWPLIALYSMLLGFIGAFDYLAVSAAIVAGSYLLYQLVERKCVGPNQQRIRVGPLVGLQAAALLLALSPDVIARSSAYQHDQWGVDRWSTGNDWQAYSTSDVASQAVQHAAATVEQSYNQKIETFITKVVDPATGAANARGVKVFGLGNSYLQSSMPMLLEYSMQNGQTFEAWQIMNCAWHASMGCTTALEQFVARVEDAGEPGGLVYVAMRYPETLESSPWLHRLLPALA